MTAADRPLQSPVRPATPPPMAVIEATTIGQAWVRVASRILDHGMPARWGTLPTREVARLTVAIGSADPADEVIAHYGDSSWLAWMRSNFRDPGRVAELGGADSYAVRLRDWEHSGRDQVAWLVDRLRADAGARDAAITTFQPGSDTTYIPCVSLIDVWAPDGALEMLVYAHGLDFGKKAYGNLVELAALQQEVAARTGLRPGGLVLHVKTAHIYDPELDLMAALVDAERALLAD
jgi:thymidylate synthase